MAASITTAGCCFGGWTPVALDEPPVELGTAVFPAGTPSLGARRQEWRVPSLVPARYAAGYALSPEEQAASVQAFHAWAQSIGYRELGGGRFVHRPQRGCANGLVCAQRFLATRDRADVQPLAALFLERARAARMNVIDLASLVLGFVQETEYEVPVGEPFEVIGPALVASRGRGDCDSKSLLAVVLLQEVGIDAVLIESQAHRHGAVGIGVPSAGTTFRYQGRSYAYGETTVRGWPIGRAPPEMSTPPNDWTVEVIPQRAPASPPSPDGSQPARRRRSTSSGGSGRR